MNTKWEYAQIVLGDSSQNHPDLADLPVSVGTGAGPRYNIIDTINAAGDRGWELVQLELGLWMLFKRRK